MKINDIKMHVKSPLAAPCLSIAEYHLLLLSQTTVLVDGVVDMGRHAQQSTGYGADPPCVHVLVSFTELLDQQMPARVAVCTDLGFICRCAPQQQMMYVACNKRREDSLVQGQWRLWH